MENTNVKCHKDSVTAILEAMSSVTFPTHTEFFIVHPDGTKTQVDSVPNVSISPAGGGEQINTVVIHEPFQIRGKLHISFIGGGNKCEINPGLTVFDSLIIRFRERNYVSLGSDNAVHSLTIVNDTEPEISVNIGDDCLFSAAIAIRTSDGHTILQDGKVLNKPTKGVTIGNHVWIGNGATILKDTSLGDNVVVATMAVVTKSFDAKSLVAGVPARVVKEGITWDRRNTYVYEMQTAQEKE